MDSHMYFFDYNSLIMNAYFSHNFAVHNVKHR